MHPTASQWPSGWRSTVPKIRSGNPAKRAELARQMEEERQKPLVQRLLERTTEQAVELVRDLNGHLPEDVYLHLRAGAAGLLFVQAAVTDKPTPAEIVGQDVLSMDQIKAQVWEEAAAAYRVLHPGPWPTNPYKRRRK